MSEILYDFPTGKQCDTLRFITAMLNVYFEGNTKSEAREFIMQHLDKAHEVYSKKKQEKNMSYESYNYSNKTKYKPSNDSNMPWSNGWEEDQWWD